METGAPFENRKSKMSKPYYITTAIDYTNAAPHIGHAYEKVLADVLARYHRQSGREVLFLTGVDQHGQKVQQAAQKAGIEPQAFADEVTAHFLSLWKLLGISYDRWAATTDASHKRVVQKILQSLHDQGSLYKAAHRGFYSVRQEQFLTDKERDESGNFGPEWGEVIEISEENWYFRLSDHREWLAEFLRQRADFVQPNFRQAELVNAVAKNSGDLCISRPKSRLSWGIEFPFDPDFVTYVWFDALINYISFAGYLSADAAFEKFWPADAHVIGKDILVPAHGVYWPCMLHGMGFADEQIPTLLVHGWWNLSGGKISKSLGNVVDPRALVERYGVTAVRYYLVRDIATGRDADFSEERLVMLYNTELANGLGNLLNRALNMAQRYQGGKLQPLSEATSLDPVWKSAAAKYVEAMNANQVQAALEAVIEVVSAANAYAESSAPWKLAKDPAHAAQLSTVLTVLAESAQLAASMLLPVIPEAAAAIFEQTRLPAHPLGSRPFAPLIGNPHEVGAPVPVFPRIEK